MKSIFLTAILISMCFGGISKLIFFSYTKRTIKKIKFIKDPINKVMPFAMPVFELGVPLLFVIMGENLWLYCLTTLYYLAFIAMNLTSMYDNVECCCYGKFMKSKLGIGGGVHYIYFLIINFLAIYCYLFNGRLCTIYLKDNLWIHLFFGIVVCICGIIYRRTLEVVFRTFE